MSSTAGSGASTLESVAAGQARLSVPTRFLKSWIDTHYVGHISAALNAEFGPVAQILIFVRCLRSPRRRSKARRQNCAASAKTAAQSPDPFGALRPAVRRATGRTPAAPTFGEPLTGSPLDRRLTFATFQVGRSNELAFYAAKRVADHGSGGTPAFCPLYVHSAVGLGKTHLLQAVAHTAASTRTLGHLSDRRAIHVRFRRRAPSADLDRVQGAAESDRPPYFRRRPVPAGKVDPGRIRSCAERPARRRA